MTIDLSKLRRLGAPPPASAAPPGSNLPRCLSRSKWLLIASFIALSLSITFTARFQVNDVSAASTDSILWDMAEEIGEQAEPPVEADVQDAEATVEEANAGSEDSSQVTLGGRYTVTARGGTRPVASMGSQIATAARQYEGAPYRWAGASPSGFDCSGFTMYVYGKVGISLPRDHWGQLNSGKQVDIDELRPGDIVFFENTYARGLSHSGIYLGDDQFIHAETEWTGVVISRLRGSQWERDFFAGSRPYEK